MNISSEHMAALKKATGSQDTTDAINEASKNRLSKGFNSVKEGIKNGNIGEVGFGIAGLPRDLLLTIGGNVGSVANKALKKVSPEEEHSIKGIDKDEQAKDEIYKTMGQLNKASAGLREVVEEYKKSNPSRARPLADPVRADSGG